MFILSFQFMTDLWRMNRKIKKRRAKEERTGCHLKLRRYQDALEGDVGQG